jgi:hypothetical protein
MSASSMSFQMSRLCWVPEYSKHERLWIHLSLIWYLRKIKIKKTKLVGLVLSFVCKTKSTSKLEPKPLDWRWYLPPRPRGPVEIKITASDLANCPLGTLKWQGMPLGHVKGFWTTQRKQQGVKDPEWGWLRLAGIPHVLLTSFFWESNWTL